jgi:hypothetical protein
MRIYATHFVGRAIGPFNITHCVAESLPIVLCRATLLAFALFVLSLTASLVAEREKRCSFKVGPCHFRFLCELAARDFSSAYKGDLLSYDWPHSAWDGC